MPYQIIVHPWTNAEIVALGAVFEGDLDICTIPDGAIVKNVMAVVETSASGVNGSAVGYVGREASAAYADYLRAFNLKAAGGTVVGNQATERSTNNTTWDYPSSVDPTVIRMRIVCEDDTLDHVLGSSGSVIVEYVETL